MLWLLTTVNFALQGMFTESIAGSLLTFPTYIFVAYYASSLLAEISAIPFKFKPFISIYMLGLIGSLILYRITTNFTLIALPIAIGVAAPQVFFALTKLFNYRNSGTQFSNSFAVLLLLNGIHFLDYPFLRPDPQMAIFGFGLVLIFSICFATLLPSILNKYHTDQLTKNLIQQIEKRETVEKDLAEALAKAENLAKVKSMFLANMSHEIRTPLTGIIGLNDLLSTTNLNEEQSEYCHDIAGASQKLRRIINNILNLSKLESGTVIVERENFLLDSIISEVKNHYIRNNKSGIDITYEIIGQLPEIVVGDKGKIQQIVFNLMDNAIKYSQGKWIKFCLSYDNQRKSIIIRVIDNGIGFSPDTINQLFHRFEQKNSRNDGVGLGLSIVEQLITLMGGEISVNSELGGGAEFICVIPAPITNELSNQVNATKESTQQKIIKETKFNLLIIDDNSLNLKTIASLLKQAGYQCFLAEDGNAAKEIYLHNKIDLILTDIQLPDISGFELIKHFRTTNVHIPIVAYSAFAFDEDVAAAAAVGATDYLRKPAMFIEIQTKLNQYLE